MGWNCEIMPIDFKHVKKQFEKSMADYDKNAVVQDMMALKMMFELLKLSNQYDNILEIGTGTGLLTKYIAKDLKYKRYYGNDIVEKSKNYVKKAIPDADFICGNAMKIKLDRKFNLVISNAVFQWFENIDKIIKLLSCSMLQDGIIAFSTFSPKNFSEITEITGLSLKYKSKEELIQVMKSCGFEVLYCEEFYEPVEFKTPLEMLAHMKKTGVNSLSDKTWSVKNIKEFCDKYSNKYPKTTLTYAPIIMIAKLNANPIQMTNN